MSEQIDPADDVIDLYRRHAQAWSILRNSRFLEKPWMDRLRALLPAAPSVLDIGCGTGAPIARYLAKSGCDVTGIDAAPELIAMAKIALPECDWQVQDMRNLALPKRFDALIAWHSFFHLTADDQRNMFALFSRHAKPEAFLLFTSGRDEGEAMGEFEGTPLYHASLSQIEYRALLDQHGFDVVDHIIEDPECGGATVWLAQMRMDNS